MGFDKKPCSNCDSKLHTMLMKEHKGEYYCPDCSFPPWVQATNITSDPLISD